MADGVWKLCNICKRKIDFGATYYVCSVSTCNRKRTGMSFCSVECFDAHLPMMRHRDAWAEQEVAPSAAQAAAQAQQEADEEGQTAAVSAAPKRRIVGGPPTPVDSGPKDILVVASKLKGFIRDRSGMNTSDTVMPILSDHLRTLCTAALRQAAQDGRKTVQSRDFEAALAELRPLPPQTRH